MTATIQGLPALDTAAVGPYELWVVGSDGVVASLGRFASDGSPSLSISGTVEMADPVAVMLTLEPKPDSTPLGPSELRLLGGPLRDDRAQLDVVGYLTPNLAFEANPGTHVLATFGDPLLGGAADDAGLWLRNPGPLADTLDGSYFVDLSPLTAGWSYEGWVVADYGTPSAVWFSYGKFAPDDRRQASQRDESGLGPFSGALDYERALPFDAIVPGDDWLGNPLDVPVPGGLPLPLDLNGCQGPACHSAWVGPSRFTHVITIEPYNDRWEEPWLAEPFFLQPYRNAIGEDEPAVGRPLVLRTEAFPTGAVVLNR